VGRTEAMRLPYKIAEGETIQFIDVMSISLHLQIIQVLYRPLSNSCGRRLSAHATHASEKRSNEAFDTTAQVFVTFYPYVSVQ
jgi:hypothetical protein